MQPLRYTTGMARVVGAKLISFELQPQIHKNFNRAHIQGMHKVMLNYSHVWTTELVSITTELKDLLRTLYVTHFQHWWNIYGTVLFLVIVWALKGNKSNEHLKLAYWRPYTTVRHLRFITLAISRRHWFLEITLAVIHSWCFFQYHVKVDRGSIV